MEIVQQAEWAKAQSIVISEDLVAVAKQQLQFLAAVDRNRWLYQGPALQRAIYRYNCCWLPLLAKHAESQVTKGPLVVPLDCEWVWHCHRLNPVRYKSDCEEFYGRILDNCNVVSSVQESSKRETEEIWNELYTDEPYDFNLTHTFSDKIYEKASTAEKCTKYDLVSAVKRQSPFFYQVSRPHMNNDVFLEEAVARYKGFLHLIKRNRESSTKRFCVPTYDIDLLWHSHQLNPVSYCKDLVELIGKVLEHDDTDSDRAKGKKLDVGFSGTTKQWEETFGSRYWKAGAMHSGTAPSPLATIPYIPNIVNKRIASIEHQKTIHLPEVKVVEVLLEFVEVKNLPEEHKGNLFVSFSKTQPDIIFNAQRRLSILSESGEKQVASFRCQPTGHLLFELVSFSPSNLQILKPAKAMGSTSILLEDVLASSSVLSVEKWLELVPNSGIVSSKPICLRVAISFTTPSLAPYVLHMIRSRPFSKNSCFFPLPGKIQVAKSWTRVIDETGTEVISLQMRDFERIKVGNNSISVKKVIGITKSGEKHNLAEFSGTEWSLIDSQWLLKLQEKTNRESHLLELMGPRTVKLFPGRKLEYEPKPCQKRRNEFDFITLVEFNAEVPYGKAVALLNLKSGFFEVKEEWLVLPGITLAFVLSEILRKQGYDGLTVNEKKIKENDHLIQGAGSTNEEGKRTNFNAAVGKEIRLKTEITNENPVISGKSGGCSGGCGGGCGDCGGGCGAGCGNARGRGGCGGCSNRGSGVEIH